MSERWPNIFEPGRVIQIAHDTHHPKYNLWSGGIPAIWRIRTFWGLWSKLVIAWGTSENTLVCAPFPVPPGSDAEQVHGVRFAATKVPWDYERNLVPEDVLPGVDGPTAGDYARANHCDGGVKGAYVRANHCDGASKLTWTFLDTATGKETPAAMGDIPLLVADLAANPLGSECVPATVVPVVRTLHMTAAAVQTVPGGFVLVDVKAAGPLGDIPTLTFDDMQPHADGQPSPEVEAGPLGDAGAEGAPESKWDSWVCDACHCLAHFLPGSVVSLLRCPCGGKYHRDPADAGVKGEPR